MIKITNDLVNSCLGEARLSERNRYIHNFHEKPEDKLQRMLNAMQKGTYVRPHKHENPDKREVFIVLKGRVAVISFDDAGKVTDYIVLSKDDGQIGVEIPVGEWHTLIPLSNDTILFEVKDGPYDPHDDKIFADWAPPEGSHDTEKYNKHILKETGIIL